jgi:hypothetical protein
VPVSIANLIIELGLNRVSPDEIERMYEDLSGTKINWNKGITTDILEKHTPTILKQLGVSDKIVYDQSGRYIYAVDKPALVTRFVNNDPQTSHMVLILFGDVREGTMTVVDPALGLTSLVTNATAFNESRVLTDKKTGAVHKSAA